jgi:hypothetical protein
VDPAEQDPIEALLALMEREPLEPWLAPFEDTALPHAVRFSGNFFTTSFAFSVHTDELALIQRLRAAIAANIARPEYVEAARLRAEYDAARAARERIFIEDARRR